ncbi:hypothetical protein VPH35_072832 [Triticum aestivum]
MPARAQIPLPSRTPPGRAATHAQTSPPPMASVHAGRSNEQIERRPDPSATVAQGSRASDDAAVSVRQGPGQRRFFSAMAMELPPNPRSWTGRGRLLFQGAYKEG